jgi:hypothetical protein
MADLRDIFEIYPHEVTLKYKDRKFEVSLATVKWLEAQGIMNITDFHLEMNYDEFAGRLAVLFKKKKHAKAFKEVKKKIREDAILVADQAGLKTVREKLYGKDPI